MGRFTSRWAQLTPYDFVRVALAAILLIAAGLKCHQLATSSVLGDGLLDSRWVLMATVEFELFFGLWLVRSLCHHHGMMAGRCWVASSLSH
jgi:hypothetical protein